MVLAAGGSVMVDELTDGLLTPLGIAVSTGLSGTIGAGVAASFRPQPRMWET